MKPKKEILLETIEGKRPKFTHVLLAEAERRAEIADTDVFSNCCTSPPVSYSEVDANGDIGTCSDCKEPAGFGTLTQLEEMEI